MKKDKSEKILSSLNEYLKKRNYEVNNSTTEASEKEAGMLGLLESPSPNSYTFSATSASHAHVEHQFCKLKAWILEASEPCRSDLSQLLFPLFVHIYLELGAATGKPAANSFFQRNYQMFRVNRDYELTLRQLVNTAGDQVALIKTLRNSKYQVRLSDGNTLNYLLRYLKNSSNPIIIQIISRYIEIELDDGSVPSSTFTDLECSSSKTDTKDGASSDPSVTVGGAGSKSVDCSPDEMAAIDSVISSVRQMSHPGLSVALYTVLNSYNGACCARVSPAVDVLASGFEDSVIKIWSMVPHWSYGSPSSQVKNTNLLACEEDRLDAPVKKEEPCEGDEGGGAASTSSASGSSSSSTRLRKQASGGEIWSLRGHTGPVYDLQFTDDSSKLLSVSEDTYMRLWDISDGECIAKYSGHNYPVFRAAVSQRSMYIATGSYDLTARLWNFEYLHPLRVFAGHTASVCSLAFHPNCSYLATGSWDNSIRLWQVTDSNTARILLHHNTPVTSLSFAPHGRYLASGSDDGSVVIWDLAAGKVLSDLSHITSPEIAPQSSAAPTPNDSIVELSWSKDSSLLVAASMDGVVRTISLQSVQEDLSTSLEGSEVQSVSCCSVGPQSAPSSTLLHATLTRHNYIAAVIAQHPDR